MNCEGLYGCGCELDTPHGCTGDDTCDYWCEDCEHCFLADDFAPIPLRQYIRRGLRRLRWRIACCFYPGARYPGLTREQTMVLRKITGS